MSKRRKPTGEELQSTPSATPQVVAEERLKRSACLPLRDLACRFADGTLEVRGAVPTKYAKRLALAALVSIEGVQMIVDMISVQFPLA